MVQLIKSFQLFHDGGPNHLETNPLICRGNQWTGFYVTGTSDLLKELSNSVQIVALNGQISDSNVFK